VDEIPAEMGAVSLRRGQDAMASATVTRAIASNLMISPMDWLTEISAILYLQLSIADHQSARLPSGSAVDDCTVNSTALLWRGVQQPTKAEASATPNASAHPSGLGQLNWLDFSL